MSDKKQLNLDELDAISGGVGNPSTSVTYEYFPSNDLVFDNFCKDNGVSDEDKAQLEKRFNDEGLTMYYDGTNKRWVATNN